MEEKQVIEEKPEGATAPVDETFTPAGDAPSAAELAELKEKASKAAQYYEQLVRTTADLENYKKRAARERQEAVKFANEGVLEKLIPILDNFEMALTAANAANTTVESMRSGVQMIAQQLKGAVTDAGLQEIDAMGQPFDPNFHEALSQQETADVPEGNVVMQLRKGYRFRERLLRPASVIVAKKPGS